MRSYRDEGDVVEDFDGTTSDLGWDSKSLEEGGLFGTHTGVSSGNGHGDRGQLTGLGRGRHLVASEELTALDEVHVSEHKSDVSNDVLHESLVVVSGTVVNGSAYGSNSGWPSSMYMDRALRIMVFLPKSNSAWPRRLMRTCCICLDPTLSHEMMMIFEYSPRRRWSVCQTSIAVTRPYVKLIEVVLLPRFLVDLDHFDVW